MVCNVHSICKLKSKGVGACIVDPTRRKILLGMERFGKYASKLNVCSGSVEPEDDECLVNAIRRELKEEFKMDLSDDDFQRLFCNRFHQPRIMVLGTTPIFIAWVDSNNHSTDDMISKMLSDIHSTTLPDTYKEMNFATWYPINDEKSKCVSRFASAIMKRIRVPAPNQ